jgi:hypothetical protein
MDIISIVWLTLISVLVIVVLKKTTGKHQQKMDRYGNKMRMKKRRMKNIQQYTYYTFNFLYFVAE